MSHPITVLAVVLLVLLALDLAALRWGVDARFDHRADEDHSKSSVDWM